VSRHFSSLGNAIASFIENQGFKKKFVEADAMRLWNEIAGPVISERTEPVEIKDGILQIKVEDSSWRNELIYMEKDLRIKINSQIGKNVLKKIIFR